jgi:hypothetical protein
MAAVTYYRKIDDNDFERAIPLAQTGSGITPIQKRVDDYDIEKFIKALETQAGIPVHRAIDRKDFTTALQAVQVKLNQRACTISNGSPAVVSLAAHGFVANTAVRFQSTGVLPAGLVIGPTYYVVGGATLLAGSFNVSGSPGGPAINTTSAGSGTHVVFAV